MALLEDEILVDDINLLSINATKLGDLISKFSFLNKFKQLSDQLLNFVCMQNTVFIFVDSPRYFYSTVLTSVAMSSQKFHFQIPYKQLCSIIKSALVLKEDITFTVGNNVSVSTTNSRWDLRIMQEKIELNNIIHYNSITDFIDEVPKSDLITAVVTLSPFARLANEVLQFDGEFAFCRSNHFYIWTSLELNDKYILDRDNVKLLQVFNNLKEDTIYMSNTEDKTIFKCGTDMVVTDRLLGEPKILKELSTLQYKQTTVIAKREIQQALEQINIFPKKDLFLEIGPDGLVFINTTEHGTSKTKIDVNNDRISLTERFNINYDTLLEAIKCIKTKYVGITTLNRSEYIVIYTENVKCLLMVNY